MKNSRLISLSVFGVLSLSACMQPTSNARSSGIISHTAGPQTLAADRVDSHVACATKDGRASLAEIGNAVDGLFQILKTDRGDQTTIHARADQLNTLEKEYAEKYVEDCATTGITEENTATRIEKLTPLTTETDDAVIYALAGQIWDLFNSNLSLSNGEGKNSANPFPPVTQVN